VGVVGISVDPLSIFFCVGSPGPTVHTHIHTRTHSRNAQLTDYTWGNSHSYEGTPDPPLPTLRRMALHGGEEVREAAARPNDKRHKKGREGV
jgi:hypothetical protein